MKTDVMNVVSVCYVDLVFSFVDLFCMFPDWFASLVGPGDPFSPNGDLSFGDFSFGVVRQLQRTGLTRPSDGVRKICKTSFCRAVDHR